MNCEAGMLSLFMIGMGIFAGIVYLVCKCMYDLGFQAGKEGK